MWDVESRTVVKIHSLSVIMHPGELTTNTHHIHIQQYNNPLTYVL